jgi:hypothetical protein
MGKDFKDKRKLSSTPYGLAVFVIGKNRGKIEKCHARCLVWTCLPKRQNLKEKQIMSRSRSGRDRHWQKIGKNKKCHAHRLVWPCLPMGQNLKDEQKNVKHAIWSGRGHHRQKRGENKKCHARRLVWPCLPKGQNFKENKKCHAHGLAVNIIGKQ